IAHDDAHNVFMALPPYTGTREGEVRQLGVTPNPARVGACFSGEMLQSCKQYKGGFSYESMDTLARWGAPGVRGSAPYYTICLWHSDDWIHFLGCLDSRGSRLRGRGHPRAPVVGFSQQ